MGKSLDQESSINMDESPDVRERSFCKPKGVQQDEQIGCQGLHQGRIVLALTSFFSVPKGTNDTLMVFDSTISGINDSLWDPNFMLPPTVSLLTMVGPETHMVDLYVG